MIGDDKDNYSLSSSRLYQENMYPFKAINFFNQTSSRIIVEIIGVNNATFTFRWLTLKSMRQDSESSETLKNTDCRYKCPEINVCIAPELLCDGVKHCPSGYDESNHFCHSYTLLWTIGGGVLITTSIVLLIGYSLMAIVHKYRGKRRSIHDVNDLHCNTGNGGYLTGDTLVGPTMCSVVDVDCGEDFYGNRSSDNYRRSMDIYSPIQEFEFRLNRSNNSFNTINVACDDANGGGRIADSRIYFTSNHIPRQYNNVNNISNDDSFLYFS